LPTSFFKKAPKLSENLLFKTNSEIDEDDPIEASLKLRIKQGNIGEVVKESKMLKSSEKALARVLAGKSKAQMEAEEDLINFVLQEESREPRVHFELRFVTNAEDPIEASLKIRLNSGSITNTVAEAGLVGSA